ncbi:alpha/beta hydrolase [Actinomadura graeca]|uniref:Alpha/beta hydrolase n=1 Tax=Actinomadura graeca TaxID=2750812 RepID=A0ABX8QT74_9ACTN|nr:alpha/beta hydrolase [Actinomadura graeca]QXJ21159.1 alpha/beta hydrolase [Actinomadura graeca]
MSPTSDPAAHVPEPAFSGVRADLSVPGARLTYWDTRRPGPAVVLLHPHTGNGAVWAHQHARFAARGYRTISYSRRGHWPSETTPPPKADTADPGDTAGTLPSGADDLEALRAELGLERLHLVGAALGGAYAVDYALRFPSRVTTMTLASSLAGIRGAGALPPGWDDLPAEVQELGPVYRAADPAGTRRYAQLTALPRPAVPQPVTRAGTVAALAGLSVPTLVVAGGADPYQPPPKARELARNIARAELVVLPEAGHVGFWEFPGPFNDAVLDFLDRHRDHPNSRCNAAQRRPHSTEPST